jgi:hypothetical protein
LLEAGKGAKMSRINNPENIIGVFVIGLKFYFA